MTTKRPITREHILFDLKMLLADLWKFRDAAHERESTRGFTFANEAGGEWFVAASTSRNDGNFARGDSGLR